MAAFASSILVRGNLPEPLTLPDLSSRDSILSLAENVYKIRPNLVARLKAADGHVVIKWFGWRHPIHLPLSPTFASRAHASWTAAHALTDAGARTPEPLYAYTRRHGGFIRENFFISRAIHPHRRFRPLLRSDAPESLFETATDDLARSIARMHMSSVVHRDLTTANFLVDDNGHVFIVDLNRAKSGTEVTLRRRLADLAKVTFGSTDSNLTRHLRHLFFRVYEEECKTGLDLVYLYERYRNGLLFRRRLKKRLRRLAGRE